MKTGGFKSWAKFSSWKTWRLLVAKSLPSRFNALQNSDGRIQPPWSIAFGSGASTLYGFTQSRGEINFMPSYALQDQRSDVKYEVDAEVERDVPKLFTYEVVRVRFFVKTLVHHFRRRGMVLGYMVVDYIVVVVVPVDIRIVDKRRMVKVARILDRLRGYRGSVNRPGPVARRMDFMGEFGVKIGGAVILVIIVIVVVTRVGVVSRGYVGVRWGVVGNRGRIVRARNLQFLDERNCLKWEHVNFYHQFLDWIIFLTFGIASGFE